MTANGVGLVGVKRRLSSYQATTDASGNYAISGVPEGTSGSLTPSKPIIRSPRRYHRHQSYHRYPGAELYRHSRLLDFRNSDHW